MSQQYAAHDAVKEPHSVSVKVLRLSQPSLETQYPISQPLRYDAAPISSVFHDALPVPASLAYWTDAGSNSDAFVLSPIVKLPGSFGSAYVGETFSCTLCANNDLPDGSGKMIRDVRVEAEMKTPSAAQKLSLSAPDGAHDEPLAAGETVQRVLGFDLKEEGNHVLAVTVSYYEATETSGRTRTFRKLYQFICKPSLIVRTKVSSLGTREDGGREWALEAQLENCSDEVMLLDRVVLDAQEDLGQRDCNGGVKAMLHPGEVEQVCFVVWEQKAGEGRVVFGSLGIGWRGEMGSRGFLSTGKLGAKS